LAASSRWQASSCSKWWRLALSLRLGRFHPPQEVVGKSAEGQFNALGRSADRFGFGR
jgi:hypothetical protein